MNPPWANRWWCAQEWPCVCNKTGRNQQYIHTHREDGDHSCAACPCRSYRPDIPEQTAIRVLLGPELLPEDAYNILLGRVAADGPKEQP
jgi:hypothetical protein